jgi:hypothetical protein
MVAERIPFDAVRHIPDVLRQRPHWVVWRRQTVGGKLTKVPYSATTGRKASTTDAGTWAPFAVAQGALAAPGASYDGLGYVFSADDPYAGVDLDHCRDPQTGHVAPWASDLIVRLGSYVEVSPSGTGVHVIVRATLPAGCRHKAPYGGDGGVVEVYDRARYLTVTGEPLAGTPTIEDRQAALDTVCALVFPAKPARPPGSVPTPRAAPSASDGDLLLRARNASGSGARFRALFDAGDLSGYGGDRSAADLALCNLLARWTGGDADRVDTLFRQSALMREKWEREDYRMWTIGRALEGRIVSCDEQASSTAPAQDSCPRCQDGSTVEAKGDTGDDELARLRARVLILEDQNRRYKEREIWQAHLFSNPDVPAQHKLNAWAVRGQLEYSHRPGNEYGQRQPIRVYRKAIGARYGVGEDTAGEHLHKLAEWGAINRRVERTWDTETGAPDSALYVGATDLLLMHPEDIAPSAGPHNGWGGPRIKRCASCGSEALVIRREMVCRTCGASTPLPDVAVNAAGEQEG